MMLIDLWHSGMSPVSARTTPTLAPGQTQVVYSIYSGKKVQDHMESLPLVRACVQWRWQSRPCPLSLRPGLRRRRRDDLRLLAVHHCLEWLTEEISSRQPSFGLEEHSRLQIILVDRFGLWMCLGAVPRYLWARWGSGILGIPRPLSLGLRWKALAG